MRLDRTSYIVIISSICFLLILGFQLYWLSQSRNLIEDQFNQKVSMALCMVVGSLEGCTPGECAMKNEECVATNDDALSFTANCLRAGKINEEVINDDIQAALQFYDLPAQFDLQIVSDCDDDCDPNSPYCCKLGAYNTSTDQFLVIRFPERRSYVLGKMWLMLVSSAAILLLILLVFILAIRALLLQKKISRFNVDFFNNMAHEFRTPLSNIKLALGRVGKKRLPPDADLYLQIIEGESGKLNHNVERVLSLAKIEDGQYELSKEQVDLKRLLDSVLSDLSNLIQESKAQIKIDAEVEALLVWADPLHLSHAFKNLIENSIKYCATRPFIKIQINQVKQGVMLIFNDNGVGIDVENKKIVFDRFRRLNTGAQVKGFGLGLSYVKMIVDLHKGKINLFSQSGQGSRFELFLPQIMI